MRTGSNIRKRSDGRFEARYIKERDPQGRAVYGYCYGRTWEEAALKRETVLRQSASVREMNLLILGAGRHGREVQELAESLRLFQKIAFLDDRKPEAIGPCRDLERYVDTYPVAIPAVGDQALRMRWMGEATRAGFILPVLIHPRAVISPSAKIGYGTVVCARATVGSRSQIGIGCIIASGATIDRDVTVADGAYVGCGQVVTSNYRIDREGGILYGEANLSVFSYDAWGRAEVYSGGL